MIYIYIYLAAAIIVSIMILQSLRDNVDIQQYIWEHEIDSELRDTIINHPWMVYTSIIVASLCWPYILYLYIKAMDNYNNEFNDYDER